MCMSMAVHADTAYSSYVNNADKPVRFNNMDWYIIEDNSTAVDEGTVTLLAKDPIGVSKFQYFDREYTSSLVKSYLDKLTVSGGSFAAAAYALVPVDLMDVSVTGEKLWLLSSAEANGLPERIRKLFMSSSLT